MSVGHYDGCWLESSQHHACALAQIDRLRADLDRLTNGTWSKELARLSSVNVDLRAAYATLDAKCGAVMDDNGRLRAEIIESRRCETMAYQDCAMLEAKLAAAEREREALRDTLIDTRRFIVMACGEHGPAVKIALSRIDAALNRPCTCHPDDNPPVPCPQKYALSECKAAPAPALRRNLHVSPDADDGYTDYAAPAPDADEIMALADEHRWCDDLTRRSALRAAVEQIVRENLQRGNVLGRITAHLLGNKNNVTDEDVVIAAAEVGRKLQGALLRIERGGDRPCTCHPDDNPPVPCPKHYALTECREAVKERQP